MSDDAVSTPGHDALWTHFGLSRASWLTLPRVLLHEMPDEWQQRMADLLGELDDAFPRFPAIEVRVTFREGGRFVRPPRWLCEYRHPDREAIGRLRRTP